ncbi:thioredoxin-like protein [Sphaerosporella brunnea]|uniref:Thioredoxin-like protein n=1 Tax=Sphaerosporella brunnea TaxID=1250544 RepID=A0A5J5EQW0_9PEZI|nr:thioredoxin-like protein [Sphaerosporella brunnea]
MVDFKVEIVSDTVCPWCYVGHKRLQAAIAQFQSSGDHTFSVSWKPYQLNPSAPNTGIDKRQHYVERFGAEQAAAMHERLASIGKQMGINFSFGGKTGNTWDSRRLIEFAAEKGKQTAVVERLFAAYFENEKDITDREVLLAAAEEAGLDRAEAKEWLETGKGGNVVDREVARARMRGISGVPNFTINGFYQLSGAQDPQEFVDIFEEIAQKQV